MISFVGLVEVGEGGVGGATVRGGVGGGGCRCLGGGAEAGKELFV